MSKFFTAIPVAVEATAGLLPEGAALERVVWNPATSQVELHWDHFPFRTGKDYPIEFGAVDLKRKKLPRGVKVNVRTPADKAVPVANGAGVEVEAA